MNELTGLTRKIKRKLKKRTIMKRNLIILFLSAYSLSAIAANHMASDRISDIRNTKHNFASDDVIELPNGTRNVKAATENRVCVFCHTPHGDPAKVGEKKHFLWNRTDSSATYTNYASSSLDVTIGSLGKGSKMCLSCHDGTVAIGQVDMIGSKQNTTITMSGDNVSGGILVAGTDGRTSNLGTDLSNDHPIGFIYNKAKADADGELADPDAESYIGVRVGAGVANTNQALVDGGQTAGSDNPTTAKTRIAVPLEAAADASSGPFIKVAADGSMECTSCHDAHIRSTDNTENIKFLRLHRFQKTDPVDGPFAINSDINCLACHKKKGWAGSAHASETVADNVINADETSAREFPSDTPVWQASCLSCHDTHTVSGAEHLLLKNDSTGLSSDIEQTCYQCHGNATILAAGSEAVNIEAAAIANAHGSTAVLADNQNKHDIQDGDFTELATNLKDANRHATCTDCHNPHRTQHYTKYDVTDTTDADNTSALHKHEDGIIHSNIASGALSGTTGVEPDFSSMTTTFNPYDNNTGITFTELKGDASAATPVTKEYQVCLKCHSEYGATVGNPDTAGNSLNIALEFSPLAKSYHPVINSRNDNPNADKATVSAAADSSYVSPFDQASAGGVQTLYCSDCHSNDDQTGAKGPHGSSVSKLLTANGDALCANCHDSDQYQSDTGAVSLNSGFSCIAPAADCTATTGLSSYRNNLHLLHAKQTGVDNVCSDCHVKIPHGWRNKALLANLGDPDLEGLQARYYPNAKITINNMAASGAWQKADCTAAGCH